MRSIFLNVILLFCKRSLRLKPLFVVFFLASILPMQAQAIEGYISTVAGGSYGYTGDGGLAVNAGFRSPSSVAVDSIGNIYIADTLNHAIRKVSAATGNIETIAGTGSPGFTGDGALAINATFNQPTGVAVDSFGNVYIADSFNHSIRKISVATGNIDTVAGIGGSAGYSGDGGLAINAQLFDPKGIAVDSAGNLYIADFFNHRVRKVLVSTGNIETIAGTGSAGYTGDGGLAINATLNNPASVSIDSLGNIYIADSSNFSIRKVSVASGNINTIAGTGVNGFFGDNGDATMAQMGAPFGVGVDSSDNIYIADTSNHRIRKVTFDPSGLGTITTIAGTGLGYSGDGRPAINAKVSSPLGVSVDSIGNIYIADTSNNSIRRIEVTLPGNQPPVPTAPVILTPLNTPATSQIAANDPDAGDVQTYAITTSAVNGSATVDASGLATYTPNAGYLGTDSFIVTVTDNAGLFGAVTINVNVVTLASFLQGRISTIAGSGIVGGFSGDGGLATLAQLESVGGVAIDSAGNVYIADGINHRIRMISAVNGIISTIAGSGATGFGGGAYAGDGGLATSARLNEPVDVAIDSSGNIYIADRNNNRIRMVSASTGVISTIAGVAGAAGFSGDGGLASAAQLNNPTGVAVDGLGNIYIADSSNNRIRVISAVDGLISTFAGSGAVGYRAGGFSGDGGLAINALLDAPASVDIDSAGNVYIADTRNRRIRMVDAVTGNISTVVGTGILRDLSLASSYDGILATLANINDPNDVSVDSLGNLYIVDGAYDQVRMVSSVDGLISTISGILALPGFSGDGGLATDAQLSAPEHVSVDRAGNVYIGDAGNHRIRKIAGGGPAPTVTAIITPFDTAGVSQIVPNNPTVGATHTYAVLAVPANGSAGVDAAGLATYTPNTGFSGGDSFVVTVTDNSGFSAGVTVIVTVQAPGAGVNQAPVPTAPSIITLFETAANSQVAANDPNIGDTHSYAVTTAANNGSVVVNTAGLATYTPNAGFSGADSFVVTVTDNGGLSGTVTINVTVDAFVSNIITTVAGNGSSGYNGDGILATGAMLNLPYRVAFDSSDNLFIGGNVSHRVRMIDAASGLISTVAGTGLGGYNGEGVATAVKLNVPTGIAFDGVGNMYIADFNNHRIRMVDLSGNISTFAGNGFVGFTGDGGPATSARLFQPGAIQKSDSFNLTRVLNSRQNHT